MSSFENVIYSFVENEQVLCKAEKYSILSLYLYKRLCGCLTMIISVPFVTK